jgi:NADPH2:quinone reductase
MDLAANAGLYPGILHARSQVVVYGTGKAESQIPSQFLLVNAVTMTWIFVYELTREERAAAVAAITGMMEARRLIHNVALTLPLERVLQAHETVEQGKAAGNVVLTIP